MIGKWLEFFLGSYFRRREEKRSSMRNRYPDRLKIYRAVEAFIKHVISTGNRDPDVDPEPILQFVRDTEEAGFLFDSYIVGYVSTIRDKAADLSLKKARIHELKPSLKLEDYPANPERRSAIEQKQKLVDWFLAQPEIAREKFSKFLAVKD